jgi:RimJ/RimL family protein N-acetyltransferase
VPRTVRAPGTARNRPAGGGYHAGMSPAPEHPLLRGERVWLRPLETADILESSIDDAELGHYSGFRRPFSRAESERFAQMLVSQGETSVNFVICELGEERGIGGIGLRDIDRLNGSAEVSIFIFDRSRWGKGFGTDAMLALLDFAFGEMRLERVWLRTFDYNERAVRSYEKAGFVKEALLRHDRWHRGVYGNSHLMAILRSEWAAQERPRSWER